MTSEGVGWTVPLAQVLAELEGAPEITLAIAAAAMRVAYMHGYSAALEASTESHDPSTTSPEAAVPGSQMKGV